MTSLPIVLTVEYVGEASIDDLQSTAQGLVSQAKTLGMSIKLVIESEWGVVCSLLIHPNTELDSARNAAKVLAIGPLAWE